MYKTKFYTETYHQTLEMLKEKATFQESYSILDHPFFQKSQEEIDIGNFPNILTKEEIMFLNENKFPMEFKMIYYIVGSNIEININDFTLLKLRNIMKNSQKYKNFIDVGLTYAGMGYVYTLSYYKKTYSFFYKMDGGPCAQEVEYRYSHYKDFIPNKKDTFSFDQFKKHNRQHIEFNHINF